ncbi:DUF998 domain-containing protein [Flavihumibacter sp.]|uniref:DUF998 domain-containing protein n=1 Tax=Flavihumibacter sp. TaxID=1913981 RepID=UPI002FCB42EF
MENTLALASLIAGILSLACLLVLHFVSPEFKASWRMVSEYAFGKHKWLLTAFFFLWGLSSILLAISLWGIVSSNWAKIGVVLLFISGIGAIMGGLFDAKHKLHGLSAVLGVPFLPIAALLISYRLPSTGYWSEYRSSVLLSAHSTWISIVLMVVTMIIMMSGFKKAGMPMGPDATPPESVPPGVIAVAGYANRILVFTYILWLLLIAKILLGL